MDNDAARIQNSVNTRIRDYFNGLEDLQVVEREFPGYQIPNISLMVNEFFEQAIDDAEIIGAKKMDDFNDEDEPSLRLLLREAKISKDGEPQGLDPISPIYEKAVPAAYDERLGLAHGIVFFSFSGTRMVAYFRKGDTEVNPTCNLTIISRDIEKANNLLEEFFAYEKEHSLFKGKMLRPSVDYDSSIENANIISYNEVSWDQAILPDSVKQCLKENILDYIREAEVVRKNGFEVKRGILLHGVPGTGKSLVCSVLATELREFTKVVLSGDTLKDPLPAFQLARTYKPSLVIIEDVDMIGASREENEFRQELGALLNELDGISSREDVHVLFTTNNIRYLEDALAERPGRVDVVVEFPLPDEKLRERLIRLHANKANLEVEDFSEVLEKTANTSPAFIKELMKRALLHAIWADDVENDGIANIREKHVLNALHALQETQNASAQRIIGFGGQ